MSRFCYEGTILAKQVFAEADFRASRAVVFEHLDQWTAQRVLEIIADVVAEQDCSVRLEPVLVKHRVHLAQNPKKEPDEERSAA